MARMIADYVCRNEECENLGKVEERFVQRELRNEQSCELCGGEMHRIPAFPGGTHISWSTWRAGMRD